MKTYASVANGETGCIWIVSAAGAAVEPKPARWV